MMNPIGSPSSLAAMLNALFPSFASEIEGEELTTYHQVIQRLAPVITGYLEDVPERKTMDFCSLIDAMVAAGGEQENAIATCLLEHASQLGVRNRIRPHLSPAARRELR